VVDYLNSEARDQANAGPFASSSRKRELVAAWLAHFGADSARDLDLGTLDAIADYAARGIAPTAKPDAASESA
jgi:hypothetical protein